MQHAPNADALDDPNQDDEEIEIISASQIQMDLQGNAAGVNQLGASSGDEVEDLGLEEHYGGRIDFNQPDSPKHMVEYAVRNDYQDEQIAVAENVPISDDI